MDDNLLQVDKAILVPISDNGNPFEIGNWVAFSSYDDTTSGSAFVGIIRAISNDIATVEFVDVNLQPTGRTVIKPLFDLREYVLPSGSPSEPISVSVTDETVAVEVPSTTIKALDSEGWRVGGYLVVWGSPAQKDLTGEWFDQKTSGLLDFYKAVGKLPAAL
jgi:hypothetical protein